METGAGAGIISGPGLMGSGVSGAGATIYFKYRHMKNKTASVICCLER